MAQSMSPVATFGKIIFVPTHESVPPLPEMDLLFFKEEVRGEVFPFRAVCIDLEMDACGNSIHEAWTNLKNALIMYIAMERKAANGSITDAAKTITKAAFTESAQKRAYALCYQEAKLAYTIHALESGTVQNPIQEERQRLAALEAEQEPIRCILNTMKAA